jgi:hypothetical protein
LTFDEYDLQSVTGDPAIVQNIKQRLLMFTNEWFLNLSEGTPWIEQILVKGQVQKPVEDILKARIRETVGVVELTEFSLEQVGERGLSVLFTVVTDGGATFSDNIEVTI